MANSEAAESVIGLGETSDYLARLLARLDRLDGEAGQPPPLPLGALFSDLLAAQPDPRSLYFGTPLEYGAHQFGREEIHLPERPYLGLSEEDKQSVLETLEGYLTTKQL